MMTKLQAPTVHARRLHDS